MCHVIVNVIMLVYPRVSPEQANFQQLAYVFQQFLTDEKVGQFQVPELKQIVQFCKNF